MGSCKWCSSCSSHKLLQEDLVEVRTVTFGPPYYALTVIVTVIVTVIITVIAESNFVQEDQRKDFRNIHKKAVRHDNTNNTYTS